MFKWLKDWGEEVKQKFYPVVPGYFGGDWLSSDLIVNPEAGDILVTTGALSAGVYVVTFRITSGTSLTSLNVTYQHRDKSNSVSLTEHSVGVSSSVAPVPYMIVLKVRESESFRIIARLNSTVLAQASINYYRLFPLRKGQ